MDQPLGQPHQNAVRDGQPARALGALTVALLAAFIALPPLLWGGPGRGIVTRQADIAEAARAGFVEQWRAGEAVSTPALAHLTDYWTGFHLLKAVIAALLVAVCLKGLFISAGWLARVGFAGTFIFAVLVFMANVQGAVAPLASLASMLPRGQVDGALPEVLRTMRRALLEHPGGGWPPPLRPLFADFASYHWALAGVGGAVTVGFVVLATMAWRRSARFTSVLCVAGALGLLVVVAANVSTAQAPAPALASFLAAWT